MNDLVEQALRATANEGDDPGADVIWDRATVAASRRRKRRRRGWVVAGATAAAAGVAIASSAFVAQRHDRRVQVVSPGVVQAPVRDALVVARDGAIWTMAPSGSGARRLTPSGCCELPAWNRDHTKIAFVHFGQLAVMNADGTGVRDLGPATVFQPAWSPDGKMIAFVESPVPGSNGGPIQVVDSDGGGLRTVANVFAGKPAWSTDGREIVFTDLDEPRRVKFVDVKTGAVRTLVGMPGAEQYSPSWSPDGRSIAFVSGAGVYSVAPNGTALRRINGCTPAFCSTDEPAFSPDGARIAFVQNLEGAETLFVAKASGGKAEPVTVPGTGPIVFDW